MLCDYIHTYIAHCSVLKLFGRSVKPKNFTAINFSCKYEFVITFFSLANADSFSNQHNIKTELIFIK